jgi:hypothetical protein
MKVLFQVQEDLGDYITLTGLPQWCLHQYHSPRQEASQVLHCKAVIFYLNDDSKG